MPRIIDYGPPYGKVTYPDEVPDRQILSDIDAWEASKKGPDIPVESYLQQIPGETVRGFTDTVASVPEGAATLANIIGKRIPGGALGFIPPLNLPARALEMAGATREELTSPLTEIGRTEGGLLRKTGQVITPAPVPELEQSFIASKIPRGIGSSLAFLAGGYAGAAAKIPAWLTVAGLGSLSSGQDFYNDAKAKGADESTAEIASLLGNVVGTSEAIPISSWVNRINKATGGAFGRALVDATAETFEEAVQEAAQQLAQNFTAKQLYDKDRSLWQDVGANAGVGGATGFLLSTLSSALGAGHARIRGQQEQPTRTVTPPPIPTLKQPDLIPGLPPPGPPPLPEEAPTKPPVSPDQLELQAYAQRTGTPTPAPSEEERLRQGEAERLRLRNAAQNRLETETGTPVVPGTPAEERTPVLQEIRNANARKIRDVIKLFPKAELTRERAEELRNLAFPELAGQPEAIEAPAKAPERYAPRAAEVRRKKARTLAEIQNLFPELKREQARELRNQAFPELAQPGAAPIEEPAAAPELIPTAQTGPAAASLVVPEDPRTEPQVAIEAIRRYPARTVNEIQRLFPKARLTSQEALQLREAAFPTGANVGAFVPEPAAAPAGAVPPIIPGTRGEAREPVLATIRRANARTIAQIQQLFPQARLNRETARKLRDQAFPEGVYGVGENPEQTRVAVAKIIRAKARSPEEIQRLIPGTTPQQAVLYIDLAYPNARYGVYTTPGGRQVFESRVGDLAQRVKRAAYSTEISKWRVNNNKVSTHQYNLPSGLTNGEIWAAINEDESLVDPLYEQLIELNPRLKGISTELPYRGPFNPKHDIVAGVASKFSPNDIKRFVEYFGGSYEGETGTAPQTTFESRVAGTPAPFRPEQLMGPFGFRTVALLNQLGPMSGQQMLGTLRNSIPPSEFNALPGLAEFLQSKPRVTPQEVQQWIAQNGPKVEKRVIRSGIAGLTPEEAAKSAELAGLRHEFYDAQTESSRHFIDSYIQEYMEDPTSQGSRLARQRVISNWEQIIARTGATVNDQQLNESAIALDRYVQLADEVNSRDIDVEGFDLSQYDFLTPIANTPQIAVMVRVPLTGTREPHKNKYGTVEYYSPEAAAKQGYFHEGGHFGSEDRNVLGWSRIQYVDRNGKKTALIAEQQDDLIDKDSNGKYYFTGQYWRDLPGDTSLFRQQSQKEGRNAQQPRFDSFNEANEALVKAWPITKDRQRLALKAAIDQAIKDGAQSIVLSDAETAMMTEGHDNLTHPRVIGGTQSFLTEDEAREFAAGKSTAEITNTGNKYLPWQVKYTNREYLKQEKGMRLNYDVVLPKIAEELTGERGLPWEGGPHQRAFTQPVRGTYLEKSYPNDVAAGQAADSLAARFARHNYNLEGNLVQIQEQAIDNPEQWIANGWRRVEGGSATRQNLIFRNPDGTPKTNVTGREYDLTKVKAKLAREGGFTLFGTDRIAPSQESRIGMRENLSIGETAVEQYLRENYGLPVQAQVQVVSEPTAQWDARSIFENGQLIRIELNEANISSTEQIDKAIEHEFAHAVELTGEVADALSLLEPAELQQIEQEMQRLGYETGDRNEFDARGVDALAQAWKGRSWFEKLVGIVSELASRLGVPMSRLAAERAAARAVARHIKGKAAPQGRDITGAFESRAENLPTFLQTREQVEAAVATPGLEPAGQQQFRELAAVQSSMVNDDFMNWYSTPASTPYEQLAKNLLEYIANRRNLSDLQRTLASLPRGTEEEKRVAEAVGATILAHHGADRATENKINNDIDSKLNQLTTATAKLPRMNQQNMKAHFLTALFNRLTADHRLYLANLAKNLPASQNQQAAYRAKLNAAENHLNTQAQAPGTLQHALSAMATTIPDTLLAPGTTNGQIIQWALNNGILQTVVPQSTQQWMLVDDGSGQPALLSYTQLRQDIADLRDIQTKTAQVQNEIDAYERWFSSTGRTGKISPKRFAEKYFSFRTSRDRAARIAGAIEKEIGDLDTEIRGLDVARSRLQNLMSSPDYVETVRQAARDADVVVLAVHNEANPKVGVGLIDRDQGRGLWRIKIPDGGEYVIDLYPTSATEKENIRKLGAFVTEAEQFAAAHERSDPLLSDEFKRLSEYVKRNLMHPSLNPENGFTQGGQLGIPGTDIKINISSSPFDWISAATGLFSFPFNTIRDAIERIGGRSTRQMMKDAFELDTVMKKVEGINNNPTYGYAAQTQANLKAIASHGWQPSQFGRWDETVAEPVLAAGQSIGPKYNIGDVIIGSGVKLTREDVAALNMMKQWEDAIRAAAPSHIREQIGELHVLRKAVGFGRYTMARTAQAWTDKWVEAWNKATTDAEKIALLNKNENFRRVVMGYMGEFNPEFALMNNSSAAKSPLLKAYRKVAETEKTNVHPFQNTDEVLDLVAQQMVSTGISPDYVTARAQAEQTLLSEIDKFTNDFKRNVLDEKTESIWGAVPKPVVEVSTAKNAFTSPRGPLQAPSTFYSYSVGSDGRRQMHVGGLRSLLNLKLLQSMEEAKAAMQNKKEEMDNEINRQINAGKSAFAAKRSVINESKRQRRLQEIQHDYNQLVRVLKILETNSNQLKAYEQSAPNHYQHAGIETLNAVTGLMKSGLLASTQAVTTNTSGGTLLGPAIFHWQTGEYLKALRDILPAPIGTNVVWNQLYKRMSAMVAGNPVMARLLRTHAPIFRQLADHIIRQSEEWKRIQRIAEVTGMVSPYNLRDQWKNRQALKTAGGRLTTETDTHMAAQIANAVLSAPGVRHVSEAIKAVFPRKFDDFINYALIMAFDHEADRLKKLGWAAFQAREASAATSGRDYKDLSRQENVLGPEELGLVTNKGLERYRQIFAPLGSLDQVLLDYYERTKGMTPEQREAEPLIPSADDHAALALHYAAISNPATETNRPLAFKRKGGSDKAFLRATAGTFMGWVTNMMHQLSKGLETHSADKDFLQKAHGYLGLAMITILLAAVGAWNWEFGDELTKKITNVSSARVQLGNIQDVRTGLGYVAQALVNTVPVIGSMLGSAAGVAFTGRGNPMDMTSQILLMNFASDTYNTVKRMIQTHDVILPAADWTRRWIFPSFTRAIINRLPGMRGLVDQQNAIRSLNGSAPPGTDIKWGQGRGGDIKYSPANDEINRVIAAAYEATAHGGDVGDVRIAIENAVQAYIRAGRTRADAEKAVNVALAGKEPVRVLTGREMTPEEQIRWLGRMTAEQRADYDKAAAAWKLLGNVTGRDLGFVNEPSAGGSGGGGRIAGLPATLPRGTGLPRAASIRPPRIGGSAGLLRAPSAGLPTIRLPRAAAGRPVRPSRGRLRRSGIGSPPRLRRAAGPRISAPRLRQRRITAGRRLR